MSYGIGKQKAADQSGKIKGKGTGTSDDIKKTVPSGSYIMPKDSTDAIGEENLARLGQPTDVNLSNGEFQLSPDQVHAVGVQALDQMKGQTHTPVDQPTVGFSIGKGKPELFFANGDAVPNEDTVLGLSKKAFIGNALQQNKSQVTAASQQNKSNQQQNSGFGAFAKNMIAPQHNDGSWNPVGGLMNTATGLGMTAVGTAGGLVGGAGEGIRSTAAWIGGAENPNAGNIVGPSFDFAGDGLKQARLGWNQMFAQKPKSEDQSQSVDVSAQSATKGAVPAKDKQPALAPVATTTTTTTDQKPVVTKTQEQLPRDMFTLNQGQAQQQAQDGNSYAIQQKGNSFSYANAGAAAQARANGVREGEGLGLKVRPANDPKGVANFMQNTREMGANDAQIQSAVAQREMGLGFQGYGNTVRQAQVPQRTEAQEAERLGIMRAASTPYAGAQRGQLTAAQFAHTS